MLLRKITKNLFLFSESSTAILIFAACFGLFFANSDFYQFYFDFFHQNIFRNFSLKFFIDDFLMAIFFFLIGLELKREIFVGELSSIKRLSLPFIGALGGVIVPALIFCFINKDHPENLRGFAIPCATDIAFAYAAIKIFGNKISNSIKVFLLSLAIVDDLIAILIIAFFYTDNVDVFYLLYSALVFFILFIFAAKKIQSSILYFIFGLILWFLFFKSNIHPTIAGAALAMFVPFQTKDKFFLNEIAQKISPLVNFFILPIFVFANSGVRIENFSAEIFSNPLFLGIVFGLFFGKQIGIFLFGFLAIKLKICSLAKKSWLEFYSSAILAGIGFTMSLFIGNLAFLNLPEILDIVKLSVLFASILSFVFAYFVLRFLV